MPEPEVVNSVEWSPLDLYVVFHAVDHITYLALVVALSALVCAPVPPVRTAREMPLASLGLVGLLSADCVECNVSAMYHIYAPSNFI